MSEIWVVVAYSYSPKFKQFRARAYVKSEMLGREVKHSATVAIDEDRETAINEAVRYVREIYARDGMRLDAQVLNVGRVSSVLLDNLRF